MMDMLLLWRQTRGSGKLPVHVTQDTAVPRSRSNELVLENPAVGVELLIVDSVIRIDLPLKERMLP